MGNPFSKFADTLSSLGLSLPAGVSQLASGVSFTTNTITSAAGITYPMQDMFKSYIIDPAGNVVDMSQNGTSFLCDPISKIAYFPGQVITLAGGIVLQVNDFLIGGKYHDLYNQLNNLGNSINSINDIASKISSPIMEIENGQEVFFQQN
jgi:hypothetical protein